MDAGLKKKPAEKGQVAKQGDKKGKGGKEKTPKRKGKCNFCGIEGHWERECKKKAAQAAQGGAQAAKGGGGAQAKSEGGGKPPDPKVAGSCYNCGTAGHFSKKCPHPKREKGREATCPATPPPYSEDGYESGNLARVEQIRAVKHGRRWVKGRPTPTFGCRVEAGGRSFYVAALPDTGATKSCVSSRVLRRHGLSRRVHTEDGLRMVGINGAETKVVGFIDLACVTEFGDAADIQCLVIDDLSDDLVVSWHDLQNLGMISSRFPVTGPSSRGDVPAGQVSVCRKGDATSAEEARDMLLKEYSDVFSDSLEGRPPMKGPDMRIHMKPLNGEKPLHVCVSRKIPLHCEEAANALVEDLLKSGVIERVDHPTEWCSPGHFVAKSEGRVRLVTDFSRLNQFVQ